MSVNLYALIEMRPTHSNFGHPLYIGIGTAKRPFQHIRHARHPKGCPNRLLNAFICAHLAEGIEPAVSILSVHATKAEADIAEREAIAKYGRLGRDEFGILCNIAHGGQGPDVELMSDPEILAKISEAARRHWEDPEHRAAQKAKIDAYNDRPGVREAHGLRVKKGLHSEEVRAKHLAALARVNAARGPEERSR